MWLLVIGFYFLVVILPIILWLWFFLWHDRAEPEPRHLLIKTFILGIGAAFLAAAVERVFFSIIFPFWRPEILKEGISSFEDGNILLPIILLAVLAGPIEEILKYLVLKESVYQKTDFNQIADGVIYGITLALGFVFVENTLYFLGLLGSPALKLIAIPMVRGALTALLHIVCAGIIGLYLGKAKFAVVGKKALILKGLLAAIIIHSLYNLVLFSSFGIIFACLIAFSAFIYLVGQLRNPKNLIIWKLIIPKDHSKGS